MLIEDISIMDVKYISDNTRNSTDSAQDRDYYECDIEPLGSISSLAGIVSLSRSENQAVASSNEGAGSKQTMKQKVSVTAGVRYHC